jgi:hypothetical protein
MPQTLRPDDAWLTWSGAISLHKTEAWVMPWRLPFEDLALFPPEALQVRAAMPAGVRLSFYSDTTRLVGEIEPPQEAAKLDLCCDEDLFDSIEITGRPQFQFDDLPPGEKRIELWLPQYGEFRLRLLQIDDNAVVRKFEDTRPRWITYGSSITQCRTAESPTQTWPAIVARTREFNLTCLGFGGQCHLDPMIARLIRDLPADFISICAGINIQGAGSMNARAFRPALIGTVQIIREKHPDAPLVLISPICSPPRETAPNNVGFTLQTMREEVAAAVDALQSRGDKNIYYISGLEIFGPEHAHLLPDQLHPNAEGYKLMGRNFLERVIPRVFPV